jgi:hypothetical protein
MRARSSHIDVFRSWTDYLLAWLDRRPADMQWVGNLKALKIQYDPEAMFQEGRLFCDVGEYERGLDFLTRAVAKGYFVSPTLLASREFDPLRDHPAFQQVLAEAIAGRDRALAAFRDAGGERLLGRLHG